VPPVVRKLLLPFLGQDDCATHFVNLQTSSVTALDFVRQQRNSLEPGVVPRPDIPPLFVIPCAKVVQFSAHIVNRFLALVALFIEVLEVRIWNIFILTSGTRPAIRTNKMRLLRQFLLCNLDFRNSAADFRPAQPEINRRNLFQRLNVRDLTQFEPKAIKLCLEFCNRELFEPAVVERVAEAFVGGEFSPLDCLQSL
jgi:hypothetical protein